MGLHSAAPDRECQLWPRHGHLCGPALQLRPQACRQAVLSRERAAQALDAQVEANLEAAQAQAALTARGAATAAGAGAAGQPQRLDAHAGQQAADMQQQGQGQGQPVPQAGAAVLAGVGTAAAQAGPPAAAAPAVAAGRDIVEQPVAGQGDILTSRQAAQAGQQDLRALAKSGTKAGLVGQADTKTLQLWTPGASL